MATLNLRRPRDAFPDDAAECLDLLCDASRAAEGTKRMMALHVLLESRNHHHLAVVIYLYVDARSHRAQRRPAVFDTAELTTALGITVDQWKYAIGQLLRAQNTAKGKQPAFIKQTSQGRGRPPARFPLKARGGYELAPAWWLDRLTDPNPARRITPEDLRYWLGVYRSTLPLLGWCELPDPAMAKRCGVEVHRIPQCRRNLARAGLVIAVQLDTGQYAVLPLVQEPDDHKRAELGECLAGVLAARAAHLASRTVEPVHQHGRRAA